MIWEERVNDEQSNANYIEPDAPPKNKYAAKCNHLEVLSLKT